MEINPQNNIDNQNFSVPPNGQVPQTPQNPTPKNKLPLVLGGIAILVVLIVAGIYFYKTSKVNPSATNLPTENQTQQNPENNTAENTPNTPALSCGNFAELSDYVLKTIQQPDGQNTMQMNPYVITSFHWKREQGEPFVTYPIINGTQTYYGDQNNFRSNDFIVSAIKNDSNLIGQTIDEKVKSLGFVVDSFNTLPLQIFSDKNVLRVFAFRKGDDIYSIVLKTDWGYQAPGGGSVTVTCGKAISEYNKVYDALSLKMDSAVENPYGNDYVAISDVSSDGKVYALVGSSNQIKIAEYYYFDGTSIKLVSKDSYPTQCVPLESEKVGKGMRCVDKNYNQRIVTY